MMHYSNCIELFPNVHDKDGGGGVGIMVKTSIPAKQLSE